MLAFTDHTRRDQLIRIAIDQIAEKGVAGTTLQSIAAAAKVTRGTLLHHFGSKGGLVRAVLESVRDDIEGRVRERISTAAGNRVEAFLIVLAEQLFSEPRLVRVLNDPYVLVLGGGVGEPVPPRRWQALADLIADAQTAGEYDSGVDPKAHAIMFDAAVHALVVEALSDSAFSLAAAIDSFLVVLRKFTVTLTPRARSDA